MVFTIGGFFAIHIRSATPYDLTVLKITVRSVGVAVSLSVAAGAWRVRAAESPAPGGRTG